MDCIILDTGKENIKVRIAVQVSANSVLPPLNGQRIISYKPFAMTNNAK